MVITVHYGMYFPPHLFFTAVPTLRMSWWDGVKEDGIIISCLSSPSEENLQLQQGKIQIVIYRVQVCLQSRAKSTAVDRLKCLV